MAGEALLIVAACIAAVLCVACAVDLVLIYSTGRSLHQFLHPDVYAGTAGIPKHLVTPPPRFRHAHRERVAAGYSRMADSRVVICGLARNIADNMSRITRRINDTMALFRDARVVVFENDSTDGTRSLLRQWADEDTRVHVLDCPEAPACRFKHETMYAHGATSGTRMDLMAGFRNRYLRHVQQHYANYDFMLVLDMDLKGPWSLDGLATTFATDDWDVTGSAGLISAGSFGQHAMMYDMLAFRAQPSRAHLGPAQPHWLPTRDAAPTGLSSPLTLLANYMNVNFLWGGHFGGPRRRVRSVFGGLAVYRMAAIADVEYGGGDCEHVTLHNRMAAAGFDRIFLNYSQVLLAGHQGPRNILKFLLVESPALPQRPGPERGTAAAPRRSGRTQPVP